MTGSAEEGRGAAADDAHDPLFRAQGGSLYVVATPLGNLRDVTLRALDILRTVDVIAAEDTRVSRVLLRHYGVATRCMALHEHNEAERAAALIEHLAAGRSVALITDAGTPAISDPGALAVARVRAAGHAVVPVPGPSAVTAALSASGFGGRCFVFLGFLPPIARHRDALLSGVANLPAALVLYEAPHRVHATLELLAARYPSREVVIARELTKRFEAIVRLPLERAAVWMNEDANRSRGEFVLIVDAPADAAAGDAVQLEPRDERWLAALLEHVSPAQAARIAASVSGVARDVIYARARALKANVAGRGGEGDAEA